MDRTGYCFSFYPDEHPVIKRLALKSIVNVYQTRKRKLSYLTFGRVFLYQIPNASQKLAVSFIMLTD